VATWQDTVGGRVQSRRIVVVTLNMSSGIEGEGATGDINDLGYRGECKGVSRSFKTHISHGKGETFGEESGKTQQAQWKT